MTYAASQSPDPAATVEQVRLFARETLTINSAQFANTSPLRKLGQPEDVANTVSFLASPSAGFITGQTMSVDGGWVFS